MEIHPLNEIERANSGFTHRIRLVLADLTALGAATSGTINMLAPGVAGFFSNRVAIYSRTAAAGGAVSALTLSLGDSGSATRFVNAQDIYNQAAGTWIAPTIAPALLVGTFILIATLTSTSANLNALTAGELDIFVTITNQPSLLD